MLFSETDLDASMEKIETINFHQVRNSYRDTIRNELTPEIKNGNRRSAEARKYMVLFSTGSGD